MSVQEFNYKGSTNPKTSCFFRMTTVTSSRVISFQSIYPFTPIIFDIVYVQTTAHQDVPEAEYIIQKVWIMTSK